MRRRTTWTQFSIFLTLCLGACRPASITANVEDLEDSPHAMGRLNVASLGLGDVLFIDHEKRTYARLWSMKALRNGQEEETGAGSTSLALKEHIQVNISGGTPWARAWLRSNAARFFSLELDVDRRCFLPNVDIDLNQMYVAAKNRTDMPPSRNTNHVLALYEDMVKADANRYSYAVVTSVSYGSKAMIRHDRLVAEAAKAGVNLVDVGVELEFTSFKQYNRVGTDLRLLYELTGLALDRSDERSPFRADLGKSIDWSGYRRLR